MTAPTDAGGLADADAARRLDGIADRIFLDPLPGASAGPSELADEASRRAGDHAGGACAGCSTASSSTAHPRWGYSRRFGAVRVDHATHERTPKDSAHWYRGVARNRRL